MSVFNASRLLGKTVLVTGASAGIGAVSTIADARCRIFIKCSFQATAILFAKVTGNTPR